VVTRSCTDLSVPNISPCYYCELTLALIWLSERDSQLKSSPNSGKWGKCGVRDETRAGNEAPMVYGT
jgi:hypothetical protein